MAQQHLAGVDGCVRAGEANDNRASLKQSIE